MTPPDKTEVPSGPPPVNPELEKMFKNIDSMGAQPTGEQKPKFDANLTKALSKSIQKVTVLVGRKSGLKSVVLSDEERDELTDALEPLMGELDKYVEYLPYLPLIVFVVGYVAGIAGEIMQRRKTGVDEKEIARQAQIVAMQRQAWTPPPTPPPPPAPPVPVPMVPPTVGTTTTVTQSTSNTQTPVETNSSASVSI